MYLRRLPLAGRARWLPIGNSGDLHAPGLQVCVVSLLGAGGAADLLNFRKGGGVWGAAGLCVCVGLGWAERG